MVPQQIVTCIITNLQRYITMKDEKTLKEQSSRIQASPANSKLGDEVL